MPPNTPEDEGLYERAIHADDERELRRQQRREADADAEQDRAETKRSRKW